MRNGIHVRVESPGDRSNLMLVWIDPTSGKKKRRSAGTDDERLAERRAGELERQLIAGSAADGRMGWEAFRQAFESSKFPRLSQGGRAEYRTVLDAVERIVNPKTIGVMATSASVQSFELGLRTGETEIRETTIGKYLRFLRATMRWAAKGKFIREAPAITLPKIKGRKARSRPIVLEEFERMLDAVSKVRKKDTEAWVFCLRAIWETGLRISEACALSWDESTPVHLKLGDDPVIHFDVQKSGEAQDMPLTQSAIDLFSAVPLDDRHGYVFKLESRKRGVRITRKAASMVGSRIGRAAGVLLDRGRDIYASAHTLRRSFGTRLAQILKPIELQQLMRHKDFKTTAEYYIDIEVKELGESIRARLATRAEPKKLTGHKQGHSGHLTECTNDEAKTC